MRSTTLSLIGSAWLGVIFGISLGTAADLRVIAPSAPGSGWDQLAQALQKTLAHMPGAPAVSISNVPGGAGTVGLAQFASSTANEELLVTGLTMLDASLITRSHVTLDRLTPIARLTAEPFAVTVPTASPLKSLDELRSAIRGDTSKITWAGGPIGGVDHLAVILLARAVGVEPTRLNYVPFLTSAEAATAATDERVHAAILPVSEIHAGLAGDRIRVLGVTGPDRIAAIDAPTLLEVGIPLEYSNWRGLLARSGLPSPEQAKLGALVWEAVRSKTWRDHLERRGWRDEHLGPEAFGAFIRDEQIRVKEALKAAGLLKRGAD